MEQVFKDCISGDVYQNFYRHIPTTFFAKPNIRMKGMLKRAAIFAKDNGVRSMNKTIMAETGSDSQSKCDASYDSDDTRFFNV